MNDHHRSTAFVYCLDYRIQTAIDNFISSKNLVGDCDRISIAGASKDSDFVLKQLSLSHRLHHIKDIYILHHQDCGAYGLPSDISPEEEKKIHWSDMDSIRQKILSSVSPDLNVHLYFTTLDGQTLPLPEYGN